MPQETLYVKPVIKENRRSFQIAQNDHGTSGKADPKHDGHSTTKQPSGGDSHTTQGDSGHGSGDHSAGGNTEHKVHKPGDVPSPSLLFMNSCLVAVIILVLGFLTTRKLQAVPRGISNLGEWFAESMKNFTLGIIGHGGEKHIPLVGTIFIYILLSNLIGQIPGFHSPTANISMTLALGVIVFFYVQYWGIRNNGIGGHLRHFMGPSIGGKFPELFFLLGPIELLSELIKPFTLAIRLFGNIFGEDVIILVLAGLGAGIGLSFLPFQFPVLLLVLITSLVQAMVFSMLTCIYLSLVSHHDHAEEHEHGADATHGADKAHAHAASH